MSVFAHVVSRNLAPEPAATQALEYVLRDSGALRTFVGMLAPIGVSFEPRSVESERAHGDGQPDLTIYDSAGQHRLFVEKAGQHRLFVENKFWAGLTPAQPVTYLDHLPQDDELSALVFLVPEERVDSVWAELRRRCAEAELSVADERHAGTLFAGKLSGNRMLAVADWRRVLDGLATVGSVRSDVKQLRALTERMDAEAFLPIQPNELTDADVPRRMINYADLVEPIVADLVRRGVADTSDLRTSHFYHAVGRYVAMHGRLGLWLGVDLDLWRESGRTPLWWKIQEDEWYGVEGVWHELEEIFDEVRTQGRWKCIPIQLKAGVEKDEVIAGAVDQMVAIADRLCGRNDGLKP